MHTYTFGDISLTDIEIVSDEISFTIVLGYINMHLLTTPQNISMIMCQAVHSYSPFGRTALSQRRRKNTYGRVNYKKWIWRHVLLLFSSHSVPFLPIGDFHGRIHQPGFNHGYGLDLACYRGNVIHQL